MIELYIHWLYKDGRSEVWMSLVGLIGVGLNPRVSIAAFSFGARIRSQRLQIVSSNALKTHPASSGPKLPLTYWEHLALHFSYIVLTRQVL